MQILGNTQFNTAPSYFMHIDINSCFATIEQQANPLLRYKPVGVSTTSKRNGIILASSIEAKKYGIKVGTRVADAKKICPQITIVNPDPNKYRYVHHRLREILGHYTNEFYPKSIDEFILNFTSCPAFDQGLIKVGKEIKQRIKDEIGDYITVSIGISKNRFLAKTASNIKKPDGLEEITEHNYLQVFRNIELIALCGIGTQSLEKLKSMGIYTTLDLYHADPHYLKCTFGSVIGYYWHLRLRGYEIEDYKPTRKSFSNQAAISPAITRFSDLEPILSKLVEKVGFRLRKHGYKTQGIFLALRYKNQQYWHVSKKTQTIFDSRDLYKEILRLYEQAPKNPITLASVGCFNLVALEQSQLKLFENAQRQHTLVTCMDTINKKWGNFVIKPGIMISKKEYVPDSIGFGNV
ncbi:DNA polymerase IV [Patescibacteria group bacterium]|nr:DNA polymerase IV [Patescibacteria group bacterium]